MPIRSLRVQHFRSYADFSIELSPSTTIISGANGSGKTNLLEALYVIARGTSFRGSDAELLQFGKEWWRLDAAIDDADRTATFDSTRTSGRKQFVIGGNKKYRLMPQQKIPLVLFEPEDLRLLHGSPVRRRSFIDFLMGQLDPLYSAKVSKYENALRQRNNLLKTAPGRRDELFVWDVMLSDLGGFITLARKQLTSSLHGVLANTYTQIAETGDIVGVAYPYYEDTEAVAQRLLHELQAAHERDIHFGYTTVGPHRHDLLFTYNGTPAGSAASRGEVRSMVLALKLIEVSMIRERTGHTPLLLLDDVFSELDNARRQALIRASSDVQTVVTTTDGDLAQNFTDYSSIVLGKNT